MQIIEVQANRVATDPETGEERVKRSIVSRHGRGDALAWLGVSQQDISFGADAWRLSHVVLRVHFDVGERRPARVTVKLKPPAQAMFKRQRFEGQIMELRAANGALLSLDVPGSDSRTGGAPPSRPTPRAAGCRCRWPHAPGVNYEAVPGMPEADIARVLGIDPKTLRKHYREELDKGHIIANARVAESLFRKATGDGRQSVTAAIFWLKSRAGWKENSVQELSARVEAPTVIELVSPRERLLAKLEELAQNQTGELPVDCDQEAPS